MRCLPMIIRESQGTMLLNPLSGVSCFLLCPTRSGESFMHICHPERSEGPAFCRRNYSRSFASLRMTNLSYDESLPENDIPVTTVAAPFSSITTLAWPTPGGGDYEAFVSLVAHGAQLWLRRIQLRQGHAACQHPEHFHSFAGQRECRRRRLYADGQWDRIRQQFRGLLELSYCFHNLCDR